MLQKEVAAHDPDKHKDFGIILGQQNSLKYAKEVMSMAENDPELLNSIYREISEKLGMDTAMEIYQLFRGQQICFPIRFFNPARIQKCIVQEYNGSNIRTLAIKYGYSEKTVRSKGHLHRAVVNWHFYSVHEPHRAA